MTKLMIMYFYLSFIFWIKYSHIRHFRLTDKLCLLINIMFIVMFVLTYACFSIFLSVYCNVMLVTIKKKREKK